MASPEERFLSTEEVAERLQVDEQTVRRWIKSGKLEAFKPGREWRIHAVALEALLETYSSSKKVEAPPELESPERRAAEEALGQTWALYVRELQRRDEERLQQDLDKATTKKERERAGLVFYEKWMIAYVLINAAIERGQATETPELKAALHMWWERTMEFYAPARQRAKHDKLFEDLEGPIPNEETKTHSNEQH